MSTENTTTENTEAPAGVLVDPLNPVTNLPDLLKLGAVDIREYDEVDAPEMLAAVVPDGYRLEHLSLPTLPRSTPRRVTGTVTVTDVISWLAYFGKHGGPHSEVFGDVKSSTITALLNAPSAPDKPAYGDHRLVLQLEHSAAWRSWTAVSGQMLSQTGFAQHIEDRSPDLRNPDAATALELAQSLQATNGVEFESGSKLQNGQRRFVFRETIEAKAGQRGELEVPTEFEMVLQVWRGVAIAVPVTARFRYSIRREGLGMGVVLDRVEDVLDAAWASLLAELTDTLPVPVLAGRAPAYGG